MKQLAGLFGLMIFFSSCSESVQIKPAKGVWLAELVTMEDEILPFNFKMEEGLNGKLQLEVYNAEEIIPVDEIEIKGDSITINFPVFEGYLKGTFTETSIEGNFIKESLDRVVPFTATHGIKDRYPNSKTANHDVTGIWETQFLEDDGNSYPGKGIFTQEGDVVSGTFRTETGDYRYLDGVMSGDTLKLSAFDGAHAFAFKAIVTDSSLNGAFYSGNHYKATFTAKPNEGFELVNSNSLTYIKEGYEKFAFSFPNASGELVSLNDKRFENKVVVVQIMGTWCPNCLDETKYYVNYLKKHADADIEFVALAFEYAKTKEKAFNSIQRLKDRIGVSYPILLAQYGSSDKDLAQQKLPMLNHVLSYPTSIFIDKKGNVRKIHTGFNGPATGAKYVAFQKEFENFTANLVSE